MARTLVGSWMVSLVMTLAVGAKPPDLPTVPETEFKVLSPLAQEYHQPDPAASSSLFVPVVSNAAGSSALEVMSGLGGRLVAMGVVKPDGWVVLKATLSLSGGIGSLFNQGFQVELNIETPQSNWKERLARDVFEMAETHRQAGDWQEAKRWYIGIKELYPHSSYAERASERLDRYALLRIVAEAGEEQSEEPPIADANGPERLQVMPREISR